MIRIAVVEDEKVWQERIRKLIEGTFCEEVSVHIYIGGSEFEAVMERFDIVFFDVELGAMSPMDGLQLCGRYKQRYPEQEAFALILTSHTEFGRMGYLSNAFRYLDKANLEEELKEAAMTIEQIRKERACVELSFSKVGVIGIRVDSILCVETEKPKKVVCVQENSRSYLNGRFNEIAELLKPYGFYTIRKGIAVNMKHIVDVKGNVIRLNGVDRCYYVSRLNFNNFLYTYTNWQMQRASG